MIPEDIRARIVGVLGEIEREEGVRILFAVESGSRAWGFPSPDSDYDVRFVYVRPVEWYLALGKRRDVIELPIADELDVNGWDLQKALSLLLKANPVMLEWLQSPIVYRDGPLRAELARLAERTHHRQAAHYHYLHLGRNQYHRQIEGRERLALKKYFYCLRPAAALNWLRTRAAAAGRVPMDLPTLLQEIALPTALRAAIDGLLVAKAAASEMGEGRRIPVIDAFVEKEFALAEANRPGTPVIEPGLADQAHRLFLGAVLGPSVTGSV